MERSTSTTGPFRVLPSVPTVQPQLCAVIARSNGAVIRSEIAPRSQVTPKSYASSAAVSP